MESPVGEPDGKSANPKEEIDCQEHTDHAHTQRAELRGVGDPDADGARLRRQGYGAAQVGARCRCRAAAKNHS